MSKFDKLRKLRSLERSDNPHEAAAARKAADRIYAKLRHQETWMDTAPHSHLEQISQCISGCLGCDIDTRVTGDQYQVTFVGPGDLVEACILTLWASLVQIHKAVPIGCGRQKNKWLLGAAYGYCERMRQQITSDAVNAFDGPTTRETVVFTELVENTGPCGLYPDMILWGKSHGEHVAR